MILRVVVSGEANMHLLAVGFHPVRIVVLAQLVV